MASTASNLTAVILAGGKGERLRPITAALPKALVPLRGVPILKRLLDFLYGQGVSKFVVCTGYLAAQVEEFTDTLDRRDWSLKCVDSGDAAMTTRLIDARRHATGRILVCYGDTLANVDVEKLVREHEAAGNIATVSVFPLVSPFGIVDFDDSGRRRALCEPVHGSAPDIAGSGIANPIGALSSLAMAFE
ncbi:MAG: isocitrate/isopropylmalate family dehydrogenase, partial [Gemmatimonadales bacterium]